MEEFKKLGLGEGILKDIAGLGFEKPTEIQEKTIPLILKGLDIIGNSATGSGKTLAFGVAIINKSVKAKGIQSLVLTPTRELTVQVAHNLRIFSNHKNLKVQEVYGGVSMSNQIHGLKTAEIVVGTPGRILDHMRQKTLNLSKVSVLVLDEADRMVDMGFLPDVEQIIQQNPKQRQTLLFSATNSPDIDYIAKKYMNSPNHVVCGSFVDPAKLNQHYYDVPQERKFSLLLHLLKNERSKLVMVFCNTRRTSDFVARNLSKYKLDAVAIHGGLTQARRSSVMKKFNAGKLMILVCTDVAARGLDINNVSHIYNYDMPSTSNDYIHRIGRTARAGKSGDAISLVSGRDYNNFNTIQMEESIKVENRELPQFEGVYVNIQRGRDDSRGYSRGNDRRRTSNAGKRNFSRQGNRASSGGYRGGSNRGNSGGRFRGDRDGSFRTRSNLSHRDNRHHDRKRLRK